METPLLLKAARHIAYDNGFVNRTCTESEWMAKVAGYLSTEADIALKGSEGILGKLTEEELESVAGGDIEEADRLLRGKGFDGIQVVTLNAILDNIMQL